MVEQKVVDYFEYENIAMADAAELMCKAVKDSAPDKLAVLFYGYHFELAGLPYGPQASGHLALSRSRLCPHPQPSRL